MSQSPRTFCQESTDKGLEEAERFHELLFHHWNTVAREFAAGELRMPYLAEDAEGNVKGNDWANGFLERTHLWQALFEPIFCDEERGSVFVFLCCLAYEPRKTPSCGRSRSR